MGVESIQSKLTIMGVPRDQAVTKIVRTATLTAQTLEVWEQVVQVDTDTTDGTFTLTLPPVAEAAGKIYSITLIDAAGAVTVQDQDDSLDWTNFTDLDADNDGILLYSDGLKWWTLLDDVA